MAEVDTITVLDSTGVSREVPTLLSLETLLTDPAHGAADSGNPVKVGFKAIAHGTNPTAVDASDRTDWYSNTAGIPWVIGGHPNVITRSHIIADSDGAQTDAALLTIATGAK